MVLHACPSVGCPAYLSLCLFPLFPPYFFLVIGLVALNTCLSKPLNYDILEVKHTTELVLLVHVVKEEASLDL
jgi:hypothetical protein